MRTYAIIPSGGSGSRANTGLPKQYIKFNDKELLAYTVEVFQNCSKIDEIIIAARTEFFDLINSMTEKYGFSKISKIIEGGAERQDSVSNGLKSIAAQDDDIVVVHDAARPLLNNDILNESVQCAVEHGSGVVAINVRDTLINKNGNHKEYLDRENVYSIQTPQAFKYNILKKAFEYAEKTNFSGTDESMLLSHADIDFKLVEGRFDNFKVTTESDLKLFEKIVNTS